MMSKLVSMGGCVCVVCVRRHMLIGVCMIYNHNLSLSHRYGLVSVMGRRRGSLDVRKESISLCHTNYTHTHTPKHRIRPYLPVKLSLFLGLTLIYELWGGGKRGQDVDD